MAWSIAIAGRLAENEHLEADRTKEQRKSLADVVADLKRLKSQHKRLVFKGADMDAEEQLSLAMSAFDVLGRNLRRLNREELSLPADVPPADIALPITRAFLEVELDEPSDERIGEYRRQAEVRQSELDLLIKRLSAKIEHLR